MKEQEFLIKYYYDEAPPKGGDLARYRARLCVDELELVDVQAPAELYPTQSSDGLVPVEARRALCQQLMIFGLGTLGAVGRELTKLMPEEAA